MKRTLKRELKAPKTVRGEAYRVKSFLLRFKAGNVVLERGGILGGIFLPFGGLFEIYSTATGF